VIADLLQNSILDDEELEREKSVICQEIHQTNDTPDDIIFDYFQEYAYPNQAMGRSVLGNEEIVCSISSDTLRNYISKQYSAQRIIISAAGKIDHATLVSIAAEAFSNMQNLEFDQYIEPAEYLGGTLRQNRDLEQVHILLGANGFAYEDENFYPASVFSALFGGGMSSRLFQKIREERGLVYSIYSFLTSAADSGLFGIYAGTGPEEADKLLPLLRDEIDIICSGDNITIDEVARARAQLKASVLMARESTSARAEQLARQLMIFKRPKSLSETVEKIENVSIESVLKSAQKIFSSNPTMVSLGQLKNLGDIHNFSSTSI
jgi:predicted Zn-dependent peptidase